MRRRLEEPDEDHFLLCIVILHAESFKLVRSSLNEPKTR